MAARHVVELEWRRFEKIDEKIPPFGQTVVARTRTWNRKDEFETTSENFQYMKGHAVLDSEGKFKVVSCVVKDLKDPEEREHEWDHPKGVGTASGIEEERQKTSVSALQLPEQEHRDLPSIG